jgi:hypothetical protein
MRLDVHTRASQEALTGMLGDIQPCHDEPYMLEPSHADMLASQVACHPSPVWHFKPAEHQHWQPGT